VPLPAPEPGSIEALAKWAANSQISERVTERERIFAEWIKGIRRGGPNE
jgi:hypothetical protein